MTPNIINIRGIKFDEILIFLFIIYQSLKSVKMIMKSLYVIFD